MAGRTKNILNGNAPAYLRGRNIRNYEVQCLWNEERQKNRYQDRLIHNWLLLFCCQK